MKHMHIDHTSLDGDASSKIALGGTMISIICYGLTRIDINDIPFLSITVQQAAGVVGIFSGFAAGCYYVQKFLHERADRIKMKRDERKAAKAAMLPKP